MGLTVDLMHAWCFLRSNATVPLAVYHFKVISKFSCTQLKYTVNLLVSSCMAPIKYKFQFAYILSNFIPLKNALKHHIFFIIIQNDNKIIANNHHHHFCIKRLVFCFKLLYCRTVVAIILSYPKFRSLGFC